MKKVYYFLLLLFVYSCISKPKNETEAQVSADSALLENQINETDYAYVESFKGNLRCNDCPGIETEIIFINDILTYKESRKYMGKNTIDHLTGIYTTDRGYKDDEDATVYVLDYNKPGMERRF